MVAERERGRERKGRRKGGREGEIKKEKRKKKGKDMRKREDEIELVDYTDDKTHANALFQILTNFRYI